MNEQIQAKLSKLSRFLELAKFKYDDMPLKLEPWQEAFVNDVYSRQIYSKGRQEGFSFVAAVRGLGRALVLPRNSYNNIFVSINRDEAREKIRYVQALLDYLPKDIIKGKVRDNKTAIELPNDNRIQSFPSRAVRGGPRVDLVIDEAAHIKDFDVIYRGSTPSTIRGQYGVTIGSTPFGRGLYKDIFRGAGDKGSPYKIFQSHEIPWWCSEFLCKDVLRASAEAPAMPTRDRVYKFGTDPLIQEFETQMLEIFQMEFECAFFDSVGSVLTEALIDACSNGDIDCTVRDIDYEDKTMDVGEQIKIAVQEIAARNNKILFLGYDVGREINATEFTILSVDKNDKFKTEGYITLRKCPFPIQETVAHALLKGLPIKRAAIDNTGMGVQLGESLEGQYGEELVYRMTFGYLTKEEMVTGLVKTFESEMITIYPTRYLRNQLLAVKKVGSDSGRILYKSKSEKEDMYTSHADKFWSLALAIWSALDFMKGHIETTKRSPLLYQLAYYNRGRRF